MNARVFGCGVIALEGCRGGGCSKKLHEPIGGGGEILMQGNRLKNPTYCRMERSGGGGEDRDAR